MFDIQRLSDLARDHHHELLEMAKTERLLKQAEAERVGLRDRLLLAGSSALIALGQKLRAYAHQELVAPCEDMYPVKSALQRP